jgi:hypothetical protein
MKAPRPPPTMPILIFLFIFLLGFFECHYTAFF